MAPSESKLIEYIVFAKSKWFRHVHMCIWVPNGLEVLKYFLPVVERLTEG
jgi:hypothetical protein